MTDGDGGTFGPFRSGHVAVSIVVALFVTSIVVTPADAHQVDAMTPRRAGPIVRGETRMRELRQWFGAPTDRKVVQVGCVQVIRASWESSLRVYASQGETRIVDAIFVRAREISSTEHGDLTIHTRRGLRVGNTERRLRRLYPHATPETHGGHTHYRLATARTGAYLMAKVVEREVVQLEAWPYEFC